MKTILSVILLLALGACNEVVVTPEKLEYIQSKTQEICPDGFKEIELWSGTHKVSHLTAYCNNGLKGEITIPTTGEK